MTIDQLISKFQLKKKKHQLKKVKILHMLPLDYYAYSLD